MYNPQKQANPEFQPPSKIAGIIMALIALALVGSVIFIGIPYAANSSDEQIALAEKKVEDELIKQNQATIAAKLLEENAKFGYSTQMVNGKPDQNQGVTTKPNHTAKLTTNYGDIKINLDSNFAPKSVENFVRLVSRGYYNDTLIHRIVKNTDFAVIQGGDKEKKNGSGGRTAFYLSEENKNELPDEIFRVAPEFNLNEQGQPTSLKALPVFMNPNWYKNFDMNLGTVEYSKGLILMANAGQDTGTSQFFITMDKTVLPAKYSVFGSVAAEDFATLDKITSEVNPAFKEGENLDVVKAQGSGARVLNGVLVDGIPDKMLKIVSGEIIN
jgi:cyclophilin family peptidyl-prolyl cis-trans isomerase